MIQTTISYRLPRQERGLSLIELMIAMTIGLFLLAGMVGIFISSSQSHNELEKASRQIENGRYASQMLREEVELAGYYGDYQPVSSTTWNTPADPCSTTVANMGFSGTEPPSLPPGMFGYESSDTLSSGCITLLTNKRAGTDVLVVRRTSTTAIETGSLQAGEYYLQVSNCENDLLAFVLSNQAADFTLHSVRPAGTPANCLTGDLNPLRKYMVRIYYIADCNTCADGGDGIPTLKMVELTAGGSFATYALAEGIENMQIEYGVDAAGDDGIADGYYAANGLNINPAPDPLRWENVVSAKLFILARNTETTPGYTDTKKYILNSTGNPDTGIGPFNDHYRRHAYAIAARANNISGRRQQ